MIGNSSTACSSNFPLISHPTQGPCDSSALAVQAARALSKNDSAPCNEEQAHTYFESIKNFFKNNFLACSASLVGPLFIGMTVTSWIGAASASMAFLAAMCIVSAACMLLYAYLYPENPLGYLAA